MRVSTRLFIVAAVVGLYAGWLSYLHNAARGWPWHDSLANASAVAFFVPLVPLAVGIAFLANGD